MKFKDNDLGLLLYDFVLIQLLITFVSDHWFYVI
jgi:hypothetical protein